MPACKDPEKEKERRRKMSLASKILWEDPRYREKNQTSMRKKKLTEEHKKKISISVSGDRNSMKNLESAAKCADANRGKPKSEGHKIKISAIRQRIALEDWIERITPLHHAIRTSQKNYDWIQAVLERDDYRDYFSGVKGNGNLVAHHWKHFSQILKENNITTFEQAMECEALWDINNGVTMIDTNHNAYHSMWR